jgi:hypothetical protein
MHEKRTVLRVCPVCQKQFMACASQVKIGAAIYCSQKCAHAHRTTLILKRCLVCGKEFKAPLYSVKKGLSIYCSRKCCFASTEYKEKISKKLKGHYVNREAISRGQKILIANGKHNFNSESQKNATLAKNTDSYKKKKRELTTKLWQDPEFVIAQVNARHLRPNKIELYLEDILNRHLPEYKYNGDGRLGVVLAGCVPDYVNVNGQKKVIEIFGTYWHDKGAKRWHQSELGRIMAYKSVGYEPLILWEKDIRTKSEDEIVQEIKDFNDKQHIKVKVRR